MGFILAKHAYALAPSVRRTKYGAPQVVSTASFTAPVNGLDFRSPRSSPDPKSAVVLENFICKDAGIAVRPGSLLWRNNINSGGAVNTLMSYSFGGSPKLFAASGDKVYDVTSKDVGGTPAAALTTASPLTYPGRWSHTNFVTAATGYLCAIAAGGGYYTYDASGGWVSHPAGAGAGQINGVTPSLCDFVAQWKRCLMFIEASTTRMWYLPAGSIAGTVQSIDFGGQFPHGGYLEMVGSWTVDGGDGLDDLLVVLSSNGDLLIYSGTTGPASTDFQLKGRWYVGRIPIGRRAMVSFAGDIFILSEAGMNPLSAILRGEGFSDRNKAMQRVATELGQEVYDAITSTRWQVLYLPQEKLIMVNSSSEAAESGGRQWVLATNRQAWSTFSGWVAKAWALHEGNAYYSTSDGKVYKAFYGSYDGVVIQDHGGSNSDGTPCEAIMQQAFLTVSSRKQMHFQQVRLTFTGPAQPGLACYVNPEFDYTAYPSAPVWVAAPGGSAWDSALWDTDVWSPTVDGNYTTYRGVTGRGTMASLVLRVRGPGGTIFNNWDLFFRIAGEM